MQKSKLKTASIIVYAVVSVLFILCFVYMGVFENISVQNTRSPDTSSAVLNVTPEIIEDPSAPIGVRKQYRWTLQDIGTNETTLSFYLVHHYAEVCFDDELVYSLMPQDTNRIGKSVSSNWVMIPLNPGDNGKEVRVVVTPVYKSVLDRSVEFHIAPFHSLYLEQLKNDFLQLTLAAVCFAVGLFVMLAELILIWRKKTRRWDIFFLGNFIMLLGIWKITDTRFSPLLFTENPLLLGYLTIGVLFLACIVFSLYLYTRYSEFNPKLIPIVSLIASGAALFALFCQVFGIADFKETLFLAHLMIILIILALFAGMFSRHSSVTPPQSKRFWVCILLLACGVLADVLTFYIKKSSSGLIFTLLMILIYTLTLFISNILDINKLAYTDPHTGLLNKRYWDILMDGPAPIDTPICMMMLDLNGLKYINDTMGHEAGDKLIFSFANILARAIPRADAICRWGGDEFTVMLTDVDHKIAEQYIADIRSAVDAYNASGETPALCYAVGYALSTDFPGLSRKALLEKADACMYLDKQQWYQLHDLRPNTPHPLQKMTPPQ